MQLRDGQLLLSPSDVNNYLACAHRTALDMRRMRGEITLNKAPRPDAELLAERGRRHEAEFLAGLIEAGREVVEIDVEAGRLAAVAATEQAMRDGAEIVYQAAFLDPDGWVGYADFLIRHDAPSDLGDFSYEAYDTKLSKHPKPYFILQLAFYTEQIARVQGVMPERMHVVLGTNETHSFRYGDFDAYVRRVRAEFLEFMASDEEPPYPYPVEHCNYCDWWARCRDKRRDDDHLSLVALLGRGQAIKLEAAGIPTMTDLGSLPEGLKVPRLAPSTLDGLRQQARLQVHTRATGEHVREFLPPEEGRGFSRIPAPSSGDVFFDIEGDPYSGDDGLEYLFGSVTLDDGVQYRADWAHSRTAERAMFETWVDWVTARLAADPAMHIYHYNHYEPTALKKLMSRYGTREDEVDELLRREVFVDLYAVVRQSMRVGEDSYSLKAMEAFYPLERDKAVTSAGGSMLAYQQWVESGDPAQLDAIAEYNADDCRSTAALRDWLLAERDEAAREFGVVLPNRDARPEREVSDATLERTAALDALREQLCAGLPEDEDADLEGEPRARRLMSDLLDYHRREEKPAWWAYFDRLAKTPGELAEEDPEAIGDLVLADDVPRRAIRKSWLIPLRFPAQQHKLRPGKALDPLTEASVTIEDLDEESGIVWIARGKSVPADKPLPRALIPPKPFGAYEQRDALMRLGRRVVDSGLDPAGPLSAGCDLLARRNPRVTGVGPGEALQTTHVDLELLCEQVTALEDSALFIQGPPGSGKTHTGAELIVDLLHRGRRVGVAATAHKAIHKLLEKVEERAAHAGVEFTGVKKCSVDNPESVFESAHIGCTADNDDVEAAGPEVNLLAGTSWLFARPGMTDKADVLFIDEAGQVALADALAMSQAARSVVLLGDPQQLAHVSQGTHPRGSGVSVLEHLLGDRPTVSPEAGVFLDQTWRMHPDVCRFVSEAMYEGRLTSRPGLERWAVESSGLCGAGAEAVAAEVALLLDRGRVVEAGGVERALELEDILVVAPFNAQVRCLVAALPAGARVGTVDKFQGQEAPIVFFSMTSSSGEDVPRGMDFLFSRNRLNVAVSRAQAMAVVVCSPRLLSAQCSSVEQMRLVNALCRFVERAA
jgi:predicted RecB family nuclease